ncbi:hypothetical protein PK98_15140 [Croceibacterium mercuriale]|uniref:Uncharacterized protein n=2 Tax=Croceibacterium mercuriale TaxID=1572751 RepID=A0A0B2BSC1_9SPHN|nr:hypothetical protein PK98_15140 [Croceibacterium mercuriale]
MVDAAGLSHIARAIQGESFTVCDLSVHGVAGCAQMRDGVHQQQMIADLVAIGFCLFVAALVGGIAVAFVDLAGRAARPFQRRRQRRRQLAAANDDTTVMGAVA